MTVLRLVGYTDFICPYCYIGGALMAETLADYDARLEWRGFEVHPELPAESLPVASLPPRMLQGLKSTVGVIAARHNIPMQLPSRLPNSRQALLGAEFARGAGRFAAYHDAVFQAYFVDDRDIGDLAELQRIAGEVDLDAEAFGRAVHDRVADPVLNAARADCERMGITGVPTWIIADRYKLTGALPPNHLRQALDNVLAEVTGSAPGT